MVSLSLLLNTEKQTDVTRTVKTYVVLFKEQRGAGLHSSYTTNIFYTTFTHESNRSSPTLKKIKTIKLPTVPSISRFMMMFSSFHCLIIWKIFISSRLSLLSCLCSALVRIESSGQMFIPIQLISIVKI